MCFEYRQHWLFISFLMLLGAFYCFRIIRVMCLGRLLAIQYWVDLSVCGTSLSEH